MFQPKMTEATEGMMEGEGYAVGHIDQMGEGYGFRKIRRALGVTAFGVNAIVLPPGYETGRHFHDQQEELYFCHRAGSRSSSATGPPTHSSPAPLPGWTPRRCARCATSARR